MKIIKRLFNAKKEQSTSNDGKNQSNKNKGTFVITGLNTGGSSWSLGNSHINKFSFADTMMRCGN